MPARSTALRLASVQPAPKPKKPISASLIQSALQGVRTKNPYATHPDKLAEVRLHGAYSSALLIDLQIHNGNGPQEAGPPLGPGGERTKIRTLPGSAGHIDRVAEPFRKLFARKDSALAEQIAAEIVAGHTLKLFE